jgi:hypothetical protein
MRETRVYIGLATVVLCLSGPAFAWAEVGTYARGAIAPTSSTSSGSVVPLATPQSGIFSCSVTWASVQAAPSGYVVGNCANGWQLRRTAKSDQFNGTWWDGGYITGNFQGCGWIQVEYSIYQSAGTTTGCAYGSVGYRLDEFARTSNDSGANPDCNRQGGKCTDGTPVQVSWPNGCDIYANGRPWLSGQTASNVMAWLPQGTTVRWRYVTKYTGSPDLMVMVRRLNVSPGQGNWGFMGRGCFGTLPYETAVG